MNSVKCSKQIMWNLFWFGDLLYMQIVNNNNSVSHSFLATRQIKHQGGLLKGHLDQHSLTIIWFRPISQVGRELEWKKYNNHWVLSQIFDINIIPFKIQGTSEKVEKWQGGLWNMAFWILLAIEPLRYTYVNQDKGGPCRNISWNREDLKISPFARNL